MALPNPEDMLFPPKPRQERISTIQLTRNTLATFPMITSASGQDPDTFGEQFNWLEAKDLVLINRVHVEAANGTFGISNRSNLEAALMRPQVCHYEDGINDILLLTVHLMMAICEKRPFAMANNVTAFSAGRTLLVANGYDFNPKIDQIRNGAGRITMIDLLDSSSKGLAVAEDFAKFLKDFIRECGRSPVQKQPFKAEMIFPPNTPKVSRKAVLASI